MKTESKPLHRLIDAIQALKEEGYEFSVHKIADTQAYGTREDFSKRVIELRCFKYFPVNGNGEEIGNIKI